MLYHQHHRRSGDSSILEILNEILLSARTPFYNTFFNILYTPVSSVKKEDDLEAKKRRAGEHIHGENLASACQVLTEVKTAQNLTSPLQTIVEHYANLEKTVAHMLAVHESEMEMLILGNTPLFKLVSDEIPVYTANKKDLEHLDKELRRLEKMEQQRKDQLEQQQQQNSTTTTQEEQMETPNNANPPNVSSTEAIEDTGSILAQREKTEKLLYEKEVLEKDLGIEEAKVTSQLLTLTSRENRYAVTVYNLMRLKKGFYENAFKTIEAELPNMERILLETSQRPVFGERLSDHLRSTGRTIALPIHLSVHNLLRFGLEEEGLFRISPKQIKLDKYKAQLDANIGVSLDEEDSHLQAGLLKCYLRELPEPLLTTVEDFSPEEIYMAWMEAAASKAKDRKIRHFQIVLGELTKQAYDNIQFLIKFLSLLSKESGSTKMNSKNLAIVLGPNLLSRCPMVDQGKLDSVISIMVTLIEHYDEIFPNDIQLDQYDEDLDTFKESNSTLVPLSQSLKLPSSQNNEQQLSPGMSQKRRQSFFALFAKTLWLNYLLPQIQATLMVLAYLQVLTTNPL
ncbi:ARHGAP17 [Lepeophtheirus salmonis]|uniref:ARHGAP17 n=1 Tax=Lepeophtheirus salmonis TaxID=72036 RepID=A0A7R8CKE3_LEPSM|nr:ARHGAP17 [Lepeophtheirus salmonis]CAF2802557.1 ARHGAP17 [Lepeophtheirus salmonis]